MDCGLCHLHSIPCYCVYHLSNMRCHHVDTLSAHIRVKSAFLSFTFDDTRTKCLPFWFKISALTFILLKRATLDLQNRKQGCLMVCQKATLPKFTTIWLEARFLAWTLVRLLKNYCTYGLIWDQDVSQPVHFDSDDKENVWHNKVHLS